MPIAEQIARSREYIEQSLERHGTGIVFFSGGKDSVALAHLMEPYRNKIKLVWVNTGAGLPHMTPFVRAYSKLFDFVELSSNQEERFKKVGLPSRLVPIFNTPLGFLSEREPQDRTILTDHVSCCAVLRILPMQEYIKANGITLSFDGQRLDDNTAIPETDSWAQLYPQGYQLCRPLWHWGEGDVMKYVRHFRLRLPEQYSEIVDSFDCCTCPAHATRPRMKYLKRAYPDLHAKTQESVAQIDDAIATEVRKLWGVNIPTEERRR